VLRELVSNPAVPGPVKLDLALVEADRVTGPAWGTLTSDEVDGIVYDSAGNPVAYRVLKEHPGDRSLNLEQETLPASKVVHYFMPSRPEQSRGIPDLVPALPLFAQLRRYTIAVLSAAETAANFAGTVETDAPANGEADPVEPMDTIELEANSLLTLPAGWKMSQVRPEQPATTYGEFKREILNEIARCLNMPFNVAAGNSSELQLRQRPPRPPDVLQVHPHRPGAHGPDGARPHPRGVVRRGEAHRVARPSAGACARGAAAPVVLGWQRARRPGEGSDRAGDAPGEPHHDPRERVRPPRQGLGRRSSRQRARELALMAELGIALPAAPASQPVDQFTEETDDDPEP
jgi:hypothetical protein